jgi:peptidoglycan/LPS O-acetylase OafA/YrhL
MMAKRGPRGGGARAGKVYLAYAVALLAGFILARFQSHAAMRYVFLIYLMVFFAFTGALPYLLPQVAKGEPGWVRHAFIKVAFPLLAVLGVVLIAAILIKVGM